MRLIDADAFEQAMYEEAFEKDSDMQRWDSGFWIRYKLYENVLDAQPTIDAEPVRHGKWANDAIGVLRCSECKAQAPWKYGRDYIDYRWEANYCPNCGARMDKE